MSLDWNATQINDVETLHADSNQWDITSDLIWATMSIGINKITFENVHEFYARMSFVYLLIGSPMTITIADIFRRIGLRTNANVETELQFVKRVGSSQLRRTRSESVGELNRTKIEQLTA